MMPVLASVDTDALLEVVWAAPAAGIGVTLAYSIAIFGSTRFVEVRDVDRLLAAAGYAILTLVALAACAAAIGFGIAIMTSK